MNHKNSIIWKRTALLVGVLALTAAGELMAQTPPAYYSYSGHKSLVASH